MYLGQFYQGIIFEKLSYCNIVGKKCSNNWFNFGKKETPIKPRFLLWEWIILWRQILPYEG